MTARDIERRAKWSAANLRDAREALTQSAELLTELTRHELAEALLKERNVLGAQLHARIVLAGEFNAGKTALLNALTDFDLGLPHPLRTTSRALEVRYGEHERWLQIRAGGDAIDVSKTEVLNDDGTDAAVSHYLVEVPSEFLSAGISIVDTPGISGGLTSPAAATVLGFVHASQAVLLVSDASQEITAPQADFLRTVADLGDPTICSVLTKTDLYAHWEEIQSVNQARLTELGASGAVLPVSAGLYTEAGLLHDDEARRESGIERLRWYLTATLLADVMQRQTASALGRGATLLAEARASLELEVQAAANPDLGSEIEGQLQAKTGQLDRLSAGLNTQVAHQLGLMSTEIGTGLERRVRTAREEIRTIIEKGDPARSWPSMQAQICDLGNRAAAEHLAALTRQQAEVIAALIEYAGAEAGRLGLDQQPQDVPTNLVPEVSDVEGLASGRISRFDLIRGSMGGLLTTTGTLGTLATLAQSAGLAAVLAPALPFLAPLGVAGAAWTFKNLSVRRKESDVEASRKEARDEANRYLTELNQGLKDDTNRFQLHMRTWLQDTLNQQVPALKQELAEEIARLGELRVASEAERNGILAKHQASIDRINHYATITRNLSVTLRRPELQPVLR